MKLKWHPINLKGKDLQFKPDNQPTWKGKLAYHVDKGTVMDIACARHFETTSNWPWIYSMNVVSACPLIGPLNFHCGMLGDIQCYCTSCSQWVWVAFWSIKAVGFVAHDSDGILDSFDNIVALHAAMPFWGCLEMCRSVCLVKLHLELCLQSLRWAHGLDNRDYCPLGDDVTMFCLADHFSDCWSSLTPSQSVQLALEVSLVVLCGLWQRISGCTVKIVVFVRSHHHDRCIHPPKARNKKQLMPIHWLLSLNGHLCFWYWGRWCWGCKQELLIIYWWLDQSSGSLPFGGVNCMLIGCSWAMQQIGAPNQFDDLGNGLNGCLDTAHFDLFSALKCSFLDPYSKTLKDSDSFCWSQVLKVQTETGSNKFFPMPPVILPYQVSWCHDPRIGVLVDRIEKTLPSSWSRSCHMIQENSCGSGKQVWNSVRKMACFQVCVKGYGWKISHFVHFSLCM